MSDINDKFAGSSSVRDLAGTMGVTASTIDVFKGARRFDESVGITGDAERIKSATDLSSGLNSTAGFAIANSLTTFDTLTGVRGLEKTSE